MTIDKAIFILEQKYKQRQNFIKTLYNEYNKLDDYEVGVCEGLSIALYILKGDKTTDEEN